MSSEKSGQATGIGTAMTRERASEAAVYKQIEADIRQRIAQGQWAVGEMLPGRRDLAKHYQVSPLTVERAITGLIAEGLLRADRRRGTFIAQMPSATGAGSPIAERPAAGAPTTIGIVGRLFIGQHSHLDLNNQWIRTIVHSIESASAQDRNVTRFINMAGRPDGRDASLPEAIEEASLANIDAIAVIAIGIDSEEIDVALDVLNRDGDSRPTVIISSSARRGRPVAQVFYDNWGAGYEAASHLIASGRRRIVLFMPATAFWAEERAAGARAAVANAGLPSDWLMVRPLEPVVWDQYVDPVELGYSAGKKVISSLQKADWDGVLCVQDQGGHGFIEAAREAGLVAGVDFGIIGFDDAELSRDLHLSSMRPPFDRMGVEAMKLLRTGLAGEPVNQEICMRCQLIARTSTAPRENRATVG